MIKYPLQVCIGSRERCETPLIKRHDTGVSLEVRLVVSRRASQYRTEIEPYYIPPGATAVFRVHKPDNTFTVTDATIESGTILCKLPPQACTTQGTCAAEVSLYNRDGKRLTSATFFFEVVDECVCDGDHPAGDYFDALGDRIKELGDIADNMLSASVNPPKLSTRNTWIVWNNETMEYEDTGVPATGENGHTPERGVDYWTAGDKREIVSEVLEALPNGDEVSY